MKKTFFLLIAIIIIAYSCRGPLPIYEWYNQPVTDVIFKDTGRKNLLSDDNLVFKPKREFVYKYTYFEANKRMGKFRIYKNTDTLLGDSVKLSPLPRKNDRRSQKICRIDYLTLQIDSTTGNFSLANTQTILRYLYQTQALGIILYPEVTGVVEDSSRVFLHPPRNYQFELLELCPFPQVYFPLKTGKSWMGKLNIPPGWFRFHKINESMLTVKFNYEIGTSQTVNTNLGKLNCYQIIGTGESTIGKSKTKYLFNPEFGFVKMEFTDPFKHTITLELIKVKN